TCWRRSRYGTGSASTSSPTSGFVTACRDRGTGGESDRVRLEIQAHRGNDRLALRRLLAAGPSSVELDVGVSDGELVVAHDVDLADASGLTVDRALEFAGDARVVLDAKCFAPATPSPGAFALALRPYLGRVPVG